MTDTAIETLLAKQAITDLLYTYCRAFDRIDDALSRTIWHPGGTCNYSSKAGVPDMPFLDYLPGSTKARRGFANHSHQITNILIELNGNSAASEAYFTASLQTAPKDGLVTEHLWRGRYLDRWSRIDGKWGIEHRQVLFDSYTPYDFAAERLKDMPLALARRDDDDPSYQHFAGVT
jgi:hypothetical protein